MARASSLLRYPWLARGLLLAALPLAACFSAEEACIDSGTQYCNRVYECYEIEDPPLASCVATSTASCDRAFGVTSTFDDCVDLLDNSSCDDLFPMGFPQVPDACRNIIAISN